MKFDEQPSLYLKIPGWFNWESIYDQMAEEAGNNGSIVEVGVLYGRSIIYLAERLKLLGKKTRIYAVDNWAGSGNDTQVDTQFNLLRSQGIDPFEVFMRNVREAGFEKKILPMRMNSVVAAKLFDDASLDGVFIDGDHTYDAVAADLAAWASKVDPGHIFAGHDSAMPGVKRAIQEFFRWPWQRLNVAGSWRVRWPLAPLQQFRGVEQQPNWDRFSHIGAARSETEALALFSKYLGMPACRSGAGRPGGSVYVELLEYDPARWDRLLFCPELPS